MTSSTIPDAKPGISNLIEILAVATGDVDPRDRSRATTGQGYGPFKEDVGEAVVALARSRSRRATGSSARTTAELRRLLAVGAEKAAAAVGADARADVRGDGLRQAVR